MNVFFIQTGYLLKGNLVDSKKRLNECLTEDPHSTIKAYCLNNLACANWWHKFPNFRDPLEDSEDDDEGEDKIETKIKTPYFDEEYSFEKIESEFLQTIPMFKRALRILEPLDQIEDINHQDLSLELLDINSIAPKNLEAFDPDKILLFKNRESGIPILNIGEFLFTTSPENRDVTLILSSKQLFGLRSA